MSNSNAQPETSRPLATLCEQDAAALDALLEARAAGADHGPMPAGSQQRAEKLEALLGLLDHHDMPSPPADLASRTVEAAQAAEQRERFARQVQMFAQPQPTLGIGWRQVGAVAAVFVIAIALLVPMANKTQSEARRIVGAAQMGATGRAISTYAADHNGVMPRTQATPGQSWLSTGQIDEQGNARSNSAHLYLLVRHNYIDPNQMVSPANPATDPLTMTADKTDWDSAEQVPWSYQNQFTVKPLRLEDNPRMAVLATRSPMFSIRDGKIYINPNVKPDASSQAYGKPGQNVLDGRGTVQWHIQPIIRDRSGQIDNIWLPYGKQQLEGNETPAHAEDSFLVP